jgi:hypothetical protein
LRTVRAVRGVGVGDRVLLVKEEVLTDG